MKTTVEESPASGRALAKESPKVRERAVLDSHCGAQIKIKNILVPLDFSRGSMQAFDYAISLAKQFNAEIQLAHVQIADEACAVPNAGHLIRECAEAATLLREKLEGQEPRPPFWPENCHIRTGRPYEQICKLALELGVDLIVLGSRGHTGLKRVLLGSTAERVARFSPCPVLVARKFKQGEFRLRRILVPTDFSQCAIAGLSYAALWAKTFNAKLSLFHVVPPVVPVLIDRVAANLPSVTRGIPADTNLEMEALIQLDFLTGTKCEPRIKIGYAVDTICSETANVDLVVMSTHGRSGLKRALIGSVAEQVVRYADCPVLVVPSQCALS